MHLLRWRKVWFVPVTIGSDPDRLVGGSCWTDTICRCDLGEQFMRPEFHFGGSHRWVGYSITPWPFLQYMIGEHILKSHGLRGYHSFSLNFLLRFSGGCLQISVVLVLFGKHRLRLRKFHDGLKLPHVLLDGRVPWAYVVPLGSLALLGDLRRWFRLSMPALSVESMCGCSRGFEALCGGWGHQKMLLRAGITLSRIDGFGLIRTQLCILRPSWRFLIGKLLLDKLV